MGRRSPASTGPANPVTFSFDHYYKLTHVKVVAVSDIATNKYPHTLWELDTLSNSIPIISFIYGARIGGMKLALKDVTAEPLEPEVQYRLFVKLADGREAQHDFSSTKK